MTLHPAIHPSMHLPILKTALAFGLVLVNYVSIPQANTSQTRFDALIVLGTPSLPDGSPSPEQRERVLEAVREYRAGVAPVLIMTGGAAHNATVEAHSMKLYAIAQGVPEPAILEEDQAQDTIQNIYFSAAILKAHGWHSAEVISEPYHLPRTALILAHYTFAWRTHAARWPAEYTAADISRKYTAEAHGCWTLTHAGFKPNRWLPVI